MDALRGQLLIWFLLHRRTRQMLGSNIFTFRWVCWGHGAHESRLVGLLGSNISTAFLIWFTMGVRQRRVLQSTISDLMSEKNRAATWQAHGTQRLLGVIQII